MARKQTFKPILYMALGLIAGLLLTFQAQGAAPQPGSAEDPIVTKSYVDQQVSRIVKEELAKMGGSPDVGKGAGSEMKIVNVAHNQRLMAEAGAEIIVRTGKAVAYVTDGTGISDVTDGKNITHGQPVLKDHLILFPRDGRGIMPDPKQKNGLIVMVRGGYQLVDR